MSRFEGSYLGAADRISDRAIMECKICWTPYDPAEGDDYRQVPPGTAFADLPYDWCCPNCDAPKEQFMVLEDPGAPAAAVAADMAEKVARLEADFREIWNGKMRDVPIVNKALHVSAVGFQEHNGGYLGVLISPWFMNLFLLPGADEDWSDLETGAKDVIDFPSGAYEFLYNRRETVGGYKACSLFSPMDEFPSQMQAEATARAVMTALFDSENRDETDRAADIRAAREAEIAATEDAQAEAAPPILTDAPTRRTVISGGMAQGAEG